MKKLFSRFALAFALAGLVNSARAVLLPVAEVVSQDARGYYSIACSKVIPVLTEAIKDQQTEIEKQQKGMETAMKEKTGKMDALEKQNDALAARLNELEAAVKALAERK
jgi:hypothetical protein